MKRKFYKKKNMVLFWKLKGNIIVLHKFVRNNGELWQMEILGKQTEKRERKGNAVFWLK